MSTAHADSPPRIGVCFCMYGPLSVIALCWTANCKLPAAWGARSLSAFAVGNRSVWPGGKL